MLRLKFQYLSLFLKYGNGAPHFPERFYLNPTFLIRAAAQIRNITCLKDSKVSRRIPDTRQPPLCW